MRMRRFLAYLLVVGTVGMPVGSAAPRQTITVSGTAKKEAKRPYTDNYVRARLVADGTIGMAVPLDASAEFVLADIAPGTYLLELLNRQGRVVCTEGPLTFTKTIGKVSINCGRDRTPLYLLLAAAGAAGLTAGIATGDPASPSR
jgi:hypothetical protein